MDPNNLARAAAIEAIHHVKWPILAIEKIDLLESVIQRQIAPLLEDKARLDWLQHFYASACFNSHMNFYQVVGLNQKNLAAAEGLREAIDAARKA